MGHASCLIPSTCLVSSPVPARYGVMPRVPMHGVWYPRLDTCSHVTRVITRHLYHLYPSWLVFAARHVFTRHHVSSPVMWCPEFPWCQYPRLDTCSQRRWRRCPHLPVSAGMDCTAIIITIFGHSQAEAECLISMRYDMRT